MISPLLHDRTVVVAAQNGIPWWYFHGLKGPYEGRRIVIAADRRPSRQGPDESLLGQVLRLGVVAQVGIELCGYPPELGGVEVIE